MGHNFSSATFCLLIVGIPALAQNTHVLPTVSASLSHESDGISVDAREARPLHQALTALREEYGLVVDYEDPVYTGSDLIDDTDPEWRRQHPTDPGVTRPAGERFVTVLKSPVTTGGDSTLSQANSLNDMLSAYNKQGGPGKFTMVRGTTARIDVVGISPALPRGVFSLLISVPATERTTGEAINQIFSEVSKQIGKKVDIGFASMNILVNTRTEAGGANVEARQLLSKVLDDTHRKLVWEAIYDADTDSYMVNILPAVQTYYSAAGEKIQVLVEAK